MNAQTFIEIVRKIKTTEDIRKAIAIRDAWLKTKPSQQERDRARGALDQLSMLEANA